MLQSEAQNGVDVHVLAELQRVFAFMCIGNNPSAAHMTRTYILIDYSIHNPERLISAMNLSKQDQQVGCMLRHFRVSRCAGCTGVLEALHQSH